MTEAGILRFPTLQRRKVWPGEEVWLGTLRLGESWDPAHAFFNLLTVSFILVSRQEAEMIELWRVFICATRI